jgi:hypothetical protein
MIKRLSNFVFYNNGFVFIVLAIIFSSGSALAATNPQVRKAVVSSEEKLVEIDNSYILDVDLDKHDFDVKITAIEKDDTDYYLTYEFHTIDLVDGVWEKIIKQNVLTVNIEQLGNRDLGLYAAEELQELVEYTKKFLAEVQENEIKKGESQKVVAKTYKGLVGRFLKEDQITFAGYNPVIKPPVKVVAKEVKPVNPAIVEVVDVKDVIIDKEPKDDNNNVVSTSTNNDISTSTENTLLDTTAPIIVLVGDSSLNLSVDDQYQELGAAANDDTDGDLSSLIVIDGVVDTTAPGSYEVTYTVADQAGNSASLSRQILVVAKEETNVNQPPDSAIEPEPTPGPAVAQDETNF